jgi:hypothetical protein
MNTSLKLHRHPGLVPAAPLLAFAIVCAQLNISAQNFDNGSTGALGDVTIDSDAIITLPVDGMLHYRSFRVSPGRTVRFTRNAHNTPVYILCQQEAVIEGTIDVSGSISPNNSPTGGASGPGGFDGGKPGFSDVPPGAGYGPGGGKGGAVNSHSPDGAGSGSYATVSSSWNTSNKGQTYGSKLLIPLIGGSGGGGAAGSPGRGGGGGGGAILISSNTRIEHSGRILSLGGPPNSAGGNGGSGGAVRLVAPVVSGAGEVDVRTQNSYAGNGRIRVDTIDRTELRLSFLPTASLSVGANMFVFPAVQSRLDIIGIAGNSLPIGSGPVTLQLPFGSSPNQNIRVQASGWGRAVPIRVVLTPDSGAPVSFDAEINNASANPAAIDIPVVIPVNALVTVHCWTR